MEEQEVVREAKPPPAASRRGRTEVAPEAPPLPQVTVSSRGRARSNVVYTESPASSEKVEARRRAGAVEAGAVEARRRTGARSKDRPGPSPREVEGREPRRATGKKEMKKSSAAVEHKEVSVEPMEARVEVEAAGKPKQSLREEPAEAEVAPEAAAEAVPGPAEAGEAVPVAAEEGARTKRARAQVSYALPSLNTKMRRDR